MTFQLQSIDAKPQIQAYIPKQIYTDQTEVDVKNLEAAVDSLNVSDAMLIYRLLCAKEVTVPDDLKQNLLELVCFYNHKDPLALDMYEERGAKEANKRSRDVKVEVWEENCFANQLFKSIEPKTSAAYNTMIRALYKHNSRDRAEDLIHEAKQNGIELELATYNAFLRNFTKPGMTTEMRWEQIKTTLNELKEKHIKPNVHTLNGILNTIKSGGNIFSIQENINKILAEFKSLGVEPCLETYTHLLDIFHGKQSPPCNLLEQIVERLEQQPDLQAQSCDDFAFFYKAMIVCRFRLKNGAKVARRLDNIVAHSDNVKFLGDAQQEQHYYRYFLTTILHNETFTEFLRTYDQLVPETYSLEPSVIDDIFSAINLSGTIHHIPKFWTDMVISGISKRFQINDTLLTLMVTNAPLEGVDEHDGLTEQFGEIAWNIYQIEMAEQFAKSRREELVPASRLANIVILLLRANRHHDAQTIVESCLAQKKDKRIIGCLTDEALNAFIDSCISYKDPYIAIQCVEYSVENGTGDALQYARKIVQSFTLEPNQIRQLTDLVGHDVLKSPSN